MTRIVEIGECNSTEDRIALIMDRIAWHTSGLSTPGISPPNNRQQDTTEATQCLPHGPTAELILHISITGKGRVGLSDDST